MKKVVAVVVCIVWFVLLTGVIIPLFNLQKQPILVQGLVMVPSVALFGVIWKFIAGRKSTGKTEGAYTKHTQGWNQHNTTTVQKEELKAKTWKGSWNMLVVCVILLALAILTVFLCRNIKHGIKLEKQTITANDLDSFGIIRQDRFGEKLKRIQEEAYADINTDADARRTDLAYREADRDPAFSKHVYRYDDRIIVSDSSQKITVYKKPIRSFLGVEFGDDFRNYYPVESTYLEVNRNGGIANVRIEDVNGFLTFKDAVAQVREGFCIDSIEVSTDNFEGATHQEYMKKVQDIIIDKYGCVLCKRTNDYEMLFKIPYCSVSEIKGIPCLRYIILSYHQENGKLCLVGRVAYKTETDLL